MLCLNCLVLSELKQHLGTETDFCYPSRDKKCKKKASTDEMSLLCGIYVQEANPRQRNLAIQPSSAQYTGVLFMNATSTPFHYLEAPTDVVFLVVLWRLRSKLSLRDLAEMFLARGFVFTHETVRDWEKRFRTRG